MSRFHRISEYYHTRFQSDDKKQKAVVALPGLSRRNFLIASATVGLVASFDTRMIGAAVPEAATDVSARGYEPTLWYSIGPDGAVSVNIKYAEMGQHIGTALARIVADELEVSWDVVKIIAVDTDARWGLMSTGGSYSVFGEFKTLSQSGAAGRIAMTEAAARLLGDEPSAYTARNGRVTGPAGTVTYAELVSRGMVNRVFTSEELAGLPLKPASERRVIGTAGRALDIPPKVDGTAIYGIDAKKESMVFARPLIPPTRYGSAVLALDDEEAKAIPGYLRTIALEDPTGFAEGVVVVLAETYPAAMKAAQLVKATWSPGRNSGISDRDIIEFGRKQIENGSGGSLLRDDEGYTEADAATDESIDAEYTTSTVLQFPLEPLNAVAWKDENGHWEVLTGNQWQSLALPQLEKAAGVASGEVIMRTHYLGGGFGRRLFGDYAIPAILASKALGGRPVKLIAERAEDTHFANPRSPSVQRFRAAINSGAVAAMEHHASAGWPTEVMAPEALAEGINKVKFDPFAIHGSEHWYSLGPQRLRALSNTLANETFVPGWLRSVGAGWINWGLECFIDEVAHRLNRDPLEFRLDRLRAEGRNQGEDPVSIGGAARQAAVLRRVAEMSGYGRSLPPDTALGIACSHGQERDAPTWCACVAQVHVDRQTGKVTCQRLDIAVDAGSIIHPDGAMAQIQGGALWGLSMALFEGTEYVNGKIRDDNLDAYTPVRMSDLPELNIQFIDGGTVPTGLGEPPVTVPAPAIGNAIFNAAGVRLRHLPIRADTVLAALKAI
jgi:isoquinoline 1-oxidoreductase beta subunit